MSAGAISGAASGAGSVIGRNGFGEMTSEQFVKILVTELTNQDPFKPNDSAQVLEQLSSLRSIESDMNLQDQLTNLVTQNQIAQASGLIGRQVQGLDAANNRIAGTVTSVRVSDGVAILELDTGRRLELGRVEQITSAAEPTKPAFV